MEIKIPIEIDDKMLQEAFDKRIAELKQKGEFALVTRCKNCNYYKKQFGTNNYLCTKRYFRILVRENDFCSYAEPKEIGGEMNNDKF